MQDVDPKRVATIIGDSGGRVVGRTRLQKIAYLLTAAGLEDSFTFRYKHYGPYSDSLATSAEIGVLLGDLSEELQPSTWGGNYSIYTAPETSAANPLRRTVCRISNETDAVALELAATAVFLAKNGYDQPWEETKRRKPDKAAADKLREAQNLLDNIKRLEIPVALPDTV